MRARGMTPGSIVLTTELIPASAVVTRHLRVPEGTPVVHSERVRTANGEPMALERTYLPAARFAGLRRPTSPRRRWPLDRAPEATPSPG